MRNTTTPRAAQQIDLDAPLRPVPRRWRRGAVVGAALLGGLLLGLVAARLLDRGAPGPETALGEAPLPAPDADVPAPPPPTGDLVPIEAASTPERAVAGFLTAEARGDFAASYAFLSTADRETYPSAAAWEAAHADLPPVTGFAVERVRDGGAVDTLVALRSTLDPVMGLIPRRSRVTWETVEEGGGRRVAFTAATATPVYPSDGPVADAARRWASSRQACATEGQVDGVLIGSPALADRLCGAAGEITLGTPGVLPDAADTTALLNAYGPEVYRWARAVDLDAPVRMRMVLGPVDDQWRVVGVLPRGRWSPMVEGPRPAETGDVEQIVALSKDAHGAWVEPSVRGVLEDPARGPGVFTVVLDGARVVSTLCLLDEVLRLEGVDLPTGQVEYVATLPEYRRRGLVRAQFEEVHRWSAERGDLLNLVEGLPYFYRRLGYEYALAFPDTYVPDWEADVALPGGYAVRRARRDEVPALQRLHEQAQAPAELVRVRRRTDWDLVLGEGEQEVWVAERDGAVRAAARVWARDDRHWVLDAAAGDLDGARALVAAALERLPRGRLAFSDRPGTPFSAVLTDVGVRTGRRIGVYARVIDPPRLLDRLRPVLSRRLAASPFADERGTLTISCYAFGLALDHDRGTVTAVRTVDGIEEPGDEAAGVPPDLLATLVLGRHGVAELARRHDDVHLGRQGALLSVLFPRLRTDVLSTA